MSPEEWLKKQQETQKPLSPEEWMKQNQPSKPPSPEEWMAQQEQPKEESGFLESLQIRSDSGKVIEEIRKQVSDEERAKLDKKAYETPILSGKVEEIRILPSEIEGIARKHKIPAEKLRSYDWAAFFGAPEATGSLGGEFAQLAEQALGSVSEMIGMGIPQKIAIEAQDDPNYKAALEDLRTVALAKKSGVLSLAELAGGFKTGIGLARAAGKAVKAAGAGEKAVKAATIGTGIGEGVVASVAGAESGFEGKAAQIGVAFGGAFAGTAEVLSVVKNRRAAAAMQKAEQELLAEADTVSKIREEAAKQDKSTDVVNKVIDLATSRSNMKQVEALANELNTTQGVKKLFGEGAEATQKIDEAAQEILQGMSAEGQRKILSDLKDAKLVQADKANPKKLRLTEAGNITVIQQHLDAQLPKVAKDLGAQTGGLRGGIEAIFTRKAEGAEFIKSQYRNAVEYDAFNKLVAQGVVKKLPPSSDNTVIQAMHQFFTDAQFIFRSIDRRTGMRLEPTLNKMNFDYNAFTRTLAHITNGYEVMDDAGNVVKKIKGLKELGQNREAVGLTSERLYAILDRPKKAGFANLSPAQKAVVKDYQDWYAYGRKEANKQGLNIEDFTRKTRGYVPHASVDNTEVAKRMRDAVSEIQKRHKINLLDYTQKDYEAAKGLRDDVLYRNLKDALEYLEGGKITKPDELTTMLSRQINPRTSGMKSVSTASATYRRTVTQVPELIRETNVDKLAARWASNTFKHAFLRGSFAEIEKTRDILIQKGNIKDAEYLTNWLTDNLGGTRARTWRAFTQEFSNTLLNVRDKGGPDSTAGRIADNMLYLGTNVVPKFFASVYPNFLGFNIRSTLQNMAQPLTTTVPELGLKGTEYAMRAYAEILRDPKMAIKMGGQYRAAQWNTELVQQLEAGLRKGAVEKSFDKAIDGYTKLAMGMYEFGEVCNRVAVVQMGKLLARDIVSGDSGARKYIKNLNVGMRNELMDAIKSNKTELVENLVINNLLDKTVFQYNRLSMSNFGRVMGPVLSVFSKWPTAIAGDVIDAYARKGVGQGSKDLAGRYMAPFMLLAVANAAISDAGAFEQDDPQIQALVGGKRGLTGLSPLQSLTQGIGVPPAAVSAKDFAMAMMAGDLDKAGSAVAKLGDAYIPMIPGLLRTINDVSRLTTAEETEYKSLEAIYRENAPEWPEL